MFGKKKKKEPKVEKVDKSSLEEEQASVAKTEGEAEPNQNPDEVGQVKAEDVNELLGIKEETSEEDEVQEEPEEQLTEAQREKAEKLKHVTKKISQILQSQNVEIIDENFGDEYEAVGVSDDEQSQQDYDSLKAMFGDKDKNKKQELTLTIDDFDYTYVGQYLDEYDLMHMKNIKRVRMQHKYPKWLKRTMIAASIVAIAGVGAYLGYIFTREVPVFLKTVTLSQTEQNYYVKDMFDYTGLYMIAEYSDGNKEQIKLDSSHFSNYEGLVKVSDNNQKIQFNDGTAAKLFFNYKGFNVECAINIIKKNETAFQAIYANGIFDLSVGDYITPDLINFAIEYGAYGKEEIKFGSNIEISVDGVKCTYEAANGYKVNNASSKTSTITVKYTSSSSSLTMNITYNKGKNIEVIYK